MPKAKKSYCVTDGNYWQGGPSSWQALYIGRAKCDECIPLAKTYGCKGGMCGTCNTKEVLKPYCEDNQNGEYHKYSNGLESLVCLRPS